MRTVLPCAASASCNIVVTGNRLSAVPTKIKIGVRMGSMFLREISWSVSHYTPKWSSIQVHGLADLALRHGHYCLFPVHGDSVFSVEHAHLGPPLPVGNARPAGPPFVEDQLFVCSRGGEWCPVSLVQRRLRYPVRTFPEAPHHDAGHRGVREADREELLERLGFGLLFLRRHYGPSVAGVVLRALAGKVEFGNANRHVEL